MQPHHRATGPARNDFEKEGVEGRFSRMSLRVPLLGSSETTTIYGDRQGTPLHIPMRQATGWGEKARHGREIHVPITSDSIASPGEGGGTIVIIIVRRKRAVIATS